MSIHRKPSLVSHVSTQHQGGLQSSMPRRTPSQDQAKAVGDFREYVELPINGLRDDSIKTLPTTVPFVGGTYWIALDHLRPAPHRHWSLRFPGDCGFSAAVLAVLSQDDVCCVKALRYTIAISRLFVEAVMRIVELLWRGLTAQGSHRPTPRSDHMDLQTAIYQIRGKQRTHSSVSRPDGFGLI